MIFSKLFSYLYLYFYSNKEESTTYKNKYDPPTPPRRLIIKPQPKEDFMSNVTSIESTDYSMRDFKDELRQLETAARAASARAIEAKYEAAQAWATYQAAQRQAKLAVPKRPAGRPKAPKEVEVFPPAPRSAFDMTDDEIRAIAHDPKWWGTIARLGLYGFPFGEETQYLEKIDAIPINTLRSMISQHKPQPLSS